MRAVLWAALACLTSLTVQASSVIDLTDANFDARTAPGNGEWMLDVYAPWCSHCQVRPLQCQLFGEHPLQDSHPCCPVTLAAPLQTLAPVWEELADDLHGKVKVGKVGAAV